MIIKKKFIAKNMTCGSCEKIIKQQAMKVTGVKRIKLSYITGKGIIEFDDNKTELGRIFKSIEEKGYECELSGRNENRISKLTKTLGWIFGVIGLVLIGYFLLHFVETIHLPELSPTMSYWLLFAVGLLTGFHCIAMCGGFVVSYTANDAKEGRPSYKSHLFYAFGKTLSYTIIGAIFGLIGSIIAFTPLMSGVAGILAGLFLVIFGLNMLNLYPTLRKLRLKMPKFLSRFSGETHEKHSSSPLIIGLLNGLMIACGPLQAIYIMAAGTGSPIEGAKLLFIFGLGTLPVMLGFGYLTSYISGKATQKILKASGAIVIILGLIMINTGLILTGSGYDARTLMTRITPVNSDSFAADSNNVAVQKVTTNSAEQAVPTTESNKDGTVKNDNAVLQKGDYQEIRMVVENNGWTPNKFILKKGVPVHWIIDAKQVLSCNGGIQVPKYNLKFRINQGLQTIEFTPTELGVVPWSCWMGMIPGTFIVVDDINSPDTAKTAETAPAPTSQANNGMADCPMMQR